MEQVIPYGPGRRPSTTEVVGYISSPPQDEVNRSLRENHDVQPGFSYSSCSAQPGWNVKYQEIRRSLCILYPMVRYSTALVAIGTKEEVEAELTMSLHDKYTQELFSNTVFNVGGRWLMVGMTNTAILEDVGHLVQIREKIKKKVQ